MELDLGFRVHKRAKISVREKFATLEDRTGLHTIDGEEIWINSDQKGFNRLASIDVSRASSWKDLLKHRDGSTTRTVSIGKYGEGSQPISDHIVLFVRR